MSNKVQIFYKIKVLRRDYETVGVFLKVVPSKLIEIGSGMSTESLLKDHKTKLIINSRPSDLGELSGGMFGVHPSFLS